MKTVIWLKFGNIFVIFTVKFLCDVHTLVYFCVSVWTYRFTTGILSQEQSGFRPVRYWLFLILI